jgi:hypothetical protein
MTLFQTHHINLSISLTCLQSTAGVGTKRAKELTKYYKEPNIMDNMIKFEKNTSISVVAKIIFIAKKSSPTIKIAIP